jgi:hypothetical protein
MKKVRCGGQKIEWLLNGKLHNEAGHFRAY